MTNKKYNKKAQIDSTLTWFVAVFIIFFILMVFLAIVFIMADKKSLVGTGDVSQKDIGYYNDPGTSENLFALLNSEIIYNGKSQKIIDALTNSSYEYINLSSTKGIDSEEVKQLHEKQKELALLIIEKGKPICYNFLLLSPIGSISPNFFVSGKLGDENDYLIKDIDESKYSPIVSYLINYKDKDIKISYKQLKNCTLITENIAGGGNNAK